MARHEPRADPTDPYVKGADVNAKNKNGSTALKLASLGNHPEVVELLKANGAKKTGPFTFRSDWLGIAVLLLISFALLLYAKIAKTQRMYPVFLWLGVAVGLVAMHLEYLMSSDNFAVFGFLLLFQPISDLIALPILRNRVMPPCVRVRKTPIYKIVVSFFCIAFGILFVTETFRAPRSLLINPSHYGKRVI